MRLITGFLFVIVITASLVSARAADKKSVLFIAGKDSHSKGAHEHIAGCEMLAEALNKSGLNIAATVCKGKWPESADAFKDVAAIVIYCDGDGKHLAIGHEKELTDLSAKGVGTVFIHYAVASIKEELNKCLTDCMGGFFKIDWSVNPTWMLKSPTLGKHAITRGVKPFDIKDEWYYHMSFRPEMKGVTPILSVLPPANTLGKTDGPRCGNPALRKEMKEGKLQHLAWASENVGGSRGFGFTGGHYHSNWSDKNFRTLVLNGIVWTAKVEVPKTGVGSKSPVITKNKSILHAIAKGDVEDIKAFIANGTDVNAKNAAGWAPIHYCGVRGKTEAAKVLIENGAKVNAQNKSKRTALHDAAERNFLDLAKLLVKHGADLKAMEQDGWTPLHFSAVKNHVEMSKFLIEKGSDVNAVSIGGGTPLHEAAANAGEPMIKLLLDNGADKSIKAKNGKTALDYANELGNKAAQKVLKK